MSTDVQPQIKRLDIDAKQSVGYCIPLWLRDLQIAAAIKRVPGRIQPTADGRDEPIAVAGFGPTLRDTWKELRAYKHVMTCSGSHKFLTERGIIPEFHVEVDPRPHKVQLIGPPNKETTYLIASTCHKAVFDHLEGMNVLLWHVFDAKEEGLRILPPGEWAITGGCDVGSRALTLAGFLGFRDVQVYGMDGCQKKDSTGKHADFHPNEPSKYSVVEFEGEEYWTTPSMLEAARQLPHELDQMPKVRFAFHGEGLVQAMMRKYKAPKDTQADKPFPVTIGFVKLDLISPEYARLNAQLHEENLAYGVGGGQHAETVLKLADSIKTHSILDYGCGKGMLAKAIPFPIWEYDPAVPGKEEAPRAADLVVCTDVLEHVEPEKIHGVLGDLKRVTRQIGYLVIHTGPSGKTLADGRNTHVLQRDIAWWRRKLQKYFKVGTIIEKPPLLHVVVERLQPPAKKVPAGKPKLLTGAAP